MTVNHTRRGVLSAGAALGAAGAALGTGAASARRQTVERPLEGRVALITGAARGFGRETAVQMARQGARLALLDIADADAMRDEIGYPLGSRSELDETVSLVEAEGGEALAIVADVRDRDAMADAVTQATAAYGGVDIVVANAGIVVSQDGLGDYTPERWHTLMSVNVYGVMNTVEAALEPLRASDHARVVILSSRAGRAGAGVVGYGVSKWAVTGLMKNLAQQLGADGIRVNAVAPGMADTPMPYYMLGNEPGEPARSQMDEDQRGRSVLPMGLLDPADVARVIVMAAGPATEAVSGTTFDVNAGSSANSLD
ncbi:SDR family oxidoreductase [Glycocaulis profundi]|nr:SDR family oxidoreductase [Glycocaulis profundi]